jgi:hypothetical protein
LKSALATLWPTGVVPLLVQVTVSPAVIDTALGEYPKSLFDGPSTMETDAPLFV